MYPQHVAPAGMPSFPPALAGSLSIGSNQQLPDANERQNLSPPPANPLPPTHGVHSVTVGVAPTFQPGVSGTSPPALGAAPPGAPVISLAQLAMATPAARVGALHPGTVPPGLPPPVPAEGAVERLLTRHRGSLVAMARARNWSAFLQATLRQNGVQAALALWGELGPHAVDLLGDDTACYVTMQMFDTLMGVSDAASISSAPHRTEAGGGHRPKGPKRSVAGGAEPVAAASPEGRLLLLRALAPVQGDARHWLGWMTRSLHSRRVFQFVLARIGLTACPSLPAAAARGVVGLATSKEGCVAVQLLLDQCATSDTACREEIFDAVRANFLALTADRFGTFVVQYTLEQAGRPANAAAALRAYRGSLLSLSRNQHASPALEAALVRLRSRAFHQMCAEELLLHVDDRTAAGVANDGRGNFVIQTLAGSVRGALQAMLMARLTPLLPFLSYGAKIQQRAQSNDRLCAAYDDGDEPAAPTLPAGPTVTVGAPPGPPMGMPGFAARLSPPAPPPLCAHACVVSPTPLAAVSPPPLTGISPQLLALTPHSNSGTISPQGFPNLISMPPGAPPAGHFAGMPAAAGFAPMPAVGTPPVAVLSSSSAGGVLPFAVTPTTMAGRRHSVVLTPRVAQSPGSSAFISAQQSRKQSLAIPPEDPTSFGMSTGILDLKLDAIPPIPAAPFSAPHPSTARTLAGPPAAQYITAPRLSIHSLASAQTVPSRSPTHPDPADEAALVAMAAANVAAD